MGTDLLCGSGVGESVAEEKFPTHAVAFLLCCHILRIR